MTFLMVVLVLVLSVDMLWVLGDGCRLKKGLMIRDDSLLNLHPLNALWHSQTSFPECCQDCVIHDTCSAIFFSPANGSCLGFVTSTPEDDVIVTAPGFLLMRLDKTCPIGQGYLYSPSLGLCLKFHKSWKNWDNAKLACEENGDHLAMLKTLKENMFVRNYMTSVSAQASHIGGYNSGGVHFWLDGTKVEGSWFSPGSRGATHYARLLIMSDGWGTGHVRTPRHYLCQRDVLAT